MYLFPTMEAIFIQDCAEIPVRVSQLSQNEAGTWEGTITSPEEIDFLKALSNKRGILRLKDGREVAIALILDEQETNVANFTVFGQLIGAHQQAQSA